jgi:hypothetical protein
LNALVALLLERLDAKRVAIFQPHHLLQLNWAWRSRGQGAQLISNHRGHLAADDYAFEQLVREGNPVIVRDERHMP